METRDNIVIGIDINKDVRTSSLAKKNHRYIGLNNAVLSTYYFASPPATHNQNHICEVIEETFTSLNVEVIRAGFLSFDSNYPYAPSDRHRLIWAELDNFSILDKPIPVCNQPIEANRVESRDARSMKQYHKTAKRFFLFKNYVFFFL